MNLKYPTIYFTIDNPNPHRPSHYAEYTQKSSWMPQHPIQRGQGLVIIGGESLRLYNRSPNIGMIATACLTTPIFPHSSKRGLRTGLLKVIPDGLPDKEVNQCPVPYPHPAVPFGPGDRLSRLPPGTWLVEFQTSPWE